MGDAEFIVEKKSNLEKKYPVQYYVKFSFIITYVLLLTTGVITFIEALRTNIPSVRHILNLETCISLIAGYFYSIFVQKINESSQNDIKIDWKDISVTRYIDWAITTPLMLLALCIVLGKNTNTPIKLPVYLTIIIMNYLMLFLGYLGETGVMNHNLSMVLGYIPFFIMFQIIFVTFVKPKYIKDNYILFTIFLSVWGLYGIVFMFNEEYKNIAMNILDLTAKCLIGLSLWVYYSKIIVL
jgi:bacteriorhodopsin